jgi:hypothetical protein
VHGLCPGEQVVDVTLVKSRAGIRLGLVKLGYLDSKLLVRAVMSEEEIGRIRVGDACEFLIVVDEP